MKNYQKWILLFCFLMVVQCGWAKAVSRISVTDFGAVPNDNIDDSQAIRRATAFCREHAGTILKFPAGIYRYCDPLALQIECEAISGAYGEDVQGRLFKPGAPYVKALDLTGCRHLTIEADGATLLLEGWYEVVSLIQVKDVKIKGLSILYKRPPSTVGRIVGSGEDFFDMSIDTSRYYYLDKVVTGRVHFYDSTRKRLYTAGECWNKQLIGSNVIRIHTNSLPVVGDYCILRHSGHYRPAIMVRESHDVVFENVKIYSQPGMGIVGHLSENITLNNVQIVPEAGNVISTNTDATHFTSCTGTVTIENCKFGGQGDDCTNIHNYYYSIYPEGNRKIEIRIENADLHAQWLDYPDVGDTMLVVSRKNIEQQGTYVVQQVDTSLTQWKVSITLDKELNLEKTDDWYMTNITRLPAVRIINNTVRSHLARAFLIKSRNVVIAGNAIQNSTIAAIKLGAEVSWHESAPVENVLVEDNWISDCGYLADSNSASAITIETSGTGQTPAKSNRHIIIRNNVIESGKQNVISVKDASDVTIANNCISGSLSPVRTENCENVTVVPF